MPLPRTPDVADLICEQIAAGASLRQIGRQIGCDAGTITKWYAEDAEFAQRYVRAKEAQAELFAEEITEISDDGTNDWIERELESGAIVQVPDHEHIQRSRLRVDSRKWLMAKMLPKKYGDRLINEHSGPDGGPIVLSVDQRVAEAKAILERAFGEMKVIEHEPTGEKK